MNASPEPTCDSKSILSLADRCVSLCSDAESAIAKLSGSDQSFLAQSLEDTLQQLEVILRAVDAVNNGGQEEPRDRGRHGFLRRLLARSESDESDSPVEIPDFDVSRQGLQGNAWTVSLPEILGFLAFGGKTGVLFVDSPEENFLLGLVDGNLMHVTSDRTPEGVRLGEVLVGLGFLTRSQLERFLATQDTTEEALSGKVLLDSGIISHDELHSALVYQVRHHFFRVVSTRNAIFRFREGLRVKLAHQVNLDINQLTLESAQADDEAACEAEREAIAQQDWNDWTEALSVELSGVMKSTKATRPEGDEKKPKVTKSEPKKEPEPPAPVAEAKPNEPSAEATPPKD